MELCIALENDIQHEKHWKNIQKVIRSTFMRFSQVMKEQAQQIEDLKNQVASFPHQINQKLDATSHQMDEKIETIKFQMTDLKASNLSHPSATQEMIDTMKDELMVYLQGDFMNSIEEKSQKTTSKIISQVLEQIHDIKEEQIFLAQALDEKSSYENLDKALSLKANKEDQDLLAAALEEKCSNEALEEALLMKADKIEVDERFDGIPTREECVELVEVQGKALEGKIISSFNEISDTLVERKKETEMFENQITRFREVILPEVIEEIENLQSQIRLVSSVQEKVVPTSSESFSPTSTSVMKKKDQNEVTRKQPESMKHNENEMELLNAQISQIQKELHETELRIMKNVVEMKQDFIHVMNQRPYHSDIQKVLGRKADAVEMWKQLSDKVDTTHLEELTSKLLNASDKFHLQTTQDLETIRRVIDGKADVKDLIIQKRQMQDLVALVQSWQHDFDQLKHDMKDKISSHQAKDLILDQKQLEDTIQALSFAKQEDIQQVFAQVKTIQKQIKSEIYQARWIWKDGRPSVETQTIHWNAQIVNTNANVFVWKKNSDTVMTIIPGLYHLQAGFFTNFTPIIQILVNGEPVFSYTEEQEVEYIKENEDILNRRNTNGLQGFQRLHHSGGNFAGISISCFLALPARSQVSVTYDIDEKAQGFLNLRKL